MLSVWDMYFASVASLKFHPRNRITDINTELRECAHIADIMVGIREERKFTHYYVEEDEK